MRPAVSAPAAPPTFPQWTPPIVAWSPASTPADPLESSGARKFGFRVALFLVFLRFSFLHEILSYEVHARNLYLVFGTTIAAISLAVMAGAVRRTLVSPTARWWLGFSVWFIVSVPFSTWRSESLHVLGFFLLSNVSLLVVVAGMTLSLRDCYAMMYAVSLGGLVNLLTGNLFQTDDPGGRIGIDFGSIANANDFAAHLMAVLPFIVFLGSSRPSKMVKILSGAAVVYGIYLIERTGSRGAMIAVVAVALFVLVRASAKVKFAFVVLGPIIVTGFVLALPKTLITRYSTLWNDRAAAMDQGATESLENRAYLLRTSIRLTLENPLFGVGAGEFADTEGREAVQAGHHGQWMVPHNSYTQLSSEIGIPGLLLFLGAIFSAFRLANSVYRRSRREPRLQKAGVAAFCILLSMIGFCAAIFFLSLAYTYYLVFLSGLAIALSRAVDRDLAPKVQPVNVTQFSLRPALPA